MTKKTLRSSKDIEKDLAVQNKAVKDFKKSWSKAKHDVFKLEREFDRSIEFEGKQKINAFNAGTDQFVFYKKVYGPRGSEAIAKLRTTKGSLRSINPYFWNCNIKEVKLRVSEAIVLEIKTLKKGKTLTKARSGWLSTFIYEVGKVVKPQYKFDEKHTNDCSSGIHGYLSRKSAERH
jgi:hypothetical protein